MNSSEEVQDVGKLAREHCECYDTLVAIGGSTNVPPFDFLQFNQFDQYIASSSPGKLTDTSLHCTFLEICSKIFITTWRMCFKSMNIVFP